MQSRNRELESVVARIRLGSSDEVAAEIQRLRDPLAFLPDEDEKIDLPPHTPQSGQMPLDIAIEILGREGDAPAQNRSPEQTGSSWVPETFHEGKLPREHDVRLAFSAFESPDTRLFFIMTPIESDEMVRRVYSAGQHMISKTDVCLLCAFAAFGSHFVSNNQTLERSKQSLFHTASMLVDESSEEDSVQCLRALLCLAMFTLIETRSSVRVTLAAGLQLARWTQLNRTIHNLNMEKSKTFRKVYRSIVMLDSYLAIKLNYHSTVTRDEVTFVVNPSIDEEPSVGNNFVLQLNSLANITKGISMRIYSDDLYGFPFVSSYMRRLEMWHEALPSSMQLSILTMEEQSNLPTGMWTALLYLHEAYLGSVVLLNCGLIPTILEQRLTALELTPAADECYRRTILTAQQCLRTNILLAYRPGAIFQRCWLLVCEIFICANIMLADVALHIFLNSDKDLEENLERIRSAMEAITHMRSMDGLVVGFLKYLRPRCSEVEALQQAKTNSLPDPLFKSKAETLLQQVIQGLRSVNQHQSKKALANAWLSGR